MLKPSTNRMTGVTEMDLKDYETSEEIKHDRKANRKLRWEKKKKKRKMKQTLLNDDARGHLDNR